MLREADEIRSNFLREIFGSDASVFENRTASVVLSTRGSEAQKITPHVAQKSKKKLDVISGAFLRKLLSSIVFIIPMLCCAMENTRSSEESDSGSWENAP